MQQIEPTGQQRLEWYLARLTAAVENQWRTKDFVDWRDRIIGYVKPEQSIEEQFAAFNRIAKRVTKHGDDHQS